jgi:exopolysaccharide biosynthesis protein
MAFTALRFIFLFFTILFSSCAATITKKISAGLIYDHIITNRSDVVHVATVNPLIYKLEIYQAKKQELNTVSYMANEHNSLVAINGCFFTKEGSCVGMLKINGNLLSKPQKKRGAVGWNDKGEFFFDRLIFSQDSKTIESDFAKNSWWEQTDNIIGGAPLIIRDGKIIDFAPEGTLESFLTERYARTAICYDKNQHIKLMVVDGGDRNTKKFGLIAGMSILEVAQFLIDQGCIHALNLDGGYSSSFVLDKTQQNSFAVPFMGERPVANAIMVVKKENQ